MNDAVGQFEIEKDQIRDLTLVEVDDVAGGMTPHSFTCSWLCPPEEKAKVKSA